MVWPYNNSVKRQQPQYDKDWEELADSKVRRPFETEESETESVYRRASGEERAEEAVESMAQRHQTIATKCR